MRDRRANPGSTDSARHMDRPWSTMKGRGANPGSTASTLPRISPPVLLAWM